MSRILSTRGCVSQHALGQTPPPPMGRHHSMHLGNPRKQVSQHAVGQAYLRQTPPLGRHPPPNVFLFTSVHSQQYGFYEKEMLQRTSKVMTFHSVIVRCIHTVLRLKYATSHPCVEFIILLSCKCCQYKLRW